jgi:methyl-accepting chemotaxis protein
MKAAMDDLINEIGPIANKYINTFTSNMLMRELVECLVQLKNTYRSREKHFEEIAKLFKEASEKMNQNFEKIKEVKSSLEKHSFKNLFYI